MWRLIVVAMLFLSAAAVARVSIILMIVVTRDSVRVLIVFGIGIAAFVICLLLIFWGLKHKDREFEAGYTTSSLAYPTWSRWMNPRAWPCGRAGSRF